MFTLTEIFGTILVAAALGMGVHEVWLYNHPHAQSYAVTTRRLRRRLFGVVLMLSLVGLLTWAGHTGDNRAKLALYIASMFAVFILFALAMADVRETSRQILRDQVGENSERMAALLSDPRFRSLVAKMGGGTLTEEELAELKRTLADGGRPDRS